MGRNETDNEDPLLDQPLLDDREMDPKDDDTLVTKLDMACFFMCAVGVAIGFSAMLASLVYFKRLYGATSFLWIQLAVYGPTLPTAIVQSRFDSVNDRLFGSRVSFLTRAILYFVGSAIAITLIPYTSPDNFGLLMTLGTIVGLLSGLAYGTFYQLVSIIKSQGKLQATFAMGYQGAGVFVFVTQIAFHFTSDIVSDPDLWYFFIVTGVFEMLALASYLILHFRSAALTAAFRSHDMSLAREKESEQKQQQDPGAGVKATRSIVYSRLEFSTAEGTIDQIRESMLGGLDDEDDDDMPTFEPSNKSPSSSPIHGLNGGKVVETEGKTFAQVTKAIWPCMLSLFMTIFGNLFVFPFYTFVPSSTGAELGQILFFVKLFGDMLGRPTTICLPCITTTTQLLTLSSIRMMLIPVFFIYCFTELIPRNDWIFCSVMGLFSFTAGYLNTVCYQLAPKLLEGNGAMIANVINTVFHTAIFLAICGSFFVRFVVLGEDIGGGGE